MKTAKKLLSVLLAMLMAFSCISAVGITASAAEKVLYKETLLPAMKDKVFTNGEKDIYVADNGKLVAETTWGFDPETFIVNKDGDEYTTGWGSKVLTVAIVDGKVTGMALSGASNDAFNGAYWEKHIHKWAEIWSSDESNHWKDCGVTDPACDATENSQKEGFGAHTGMEDYECDVCGYIDQASLVWQLMFNAIGEGNRYANENGIIFSVKTEDDKLPAVIAGSAIKFSPSYSIKKNGNVYSAEWGGAHINVTLTSDGSLELLNVSDYTGDKAVRNGDYQLCPALTDAVMTLNAAKATAKSDEAKAILDQAIADLDNVSPTDESTINAIVEKALADAKEADADLTAAKNSAKKELDAAKATYTSDDAVKALDDAKGAVDAATNKPDVESAKNAGLDAAKNAEPAQEYTWQTIYDVLGDGIRYTNGNVIYRMTSTNEGALPAVIDGSALKIFPDYKIAKNGDTYTAEWGGAHINVTVDEDGKLVLLNVSDYTGAKENRNGDYYPVADDLVFNSADRKSVV